MNADVRSQDGSWKSVSDYCVTVTVSLENLTNQNIYYYNCSQVHQKLFWMILKNASVDATDSIWLHCIKFIKRAHTEPARHSFEEEGTERVQARVDAKGVFSLMRPSRITTPEFLVPLWTPDMVSGPHITIWTRYGLGNQCLAPLSCFYMYIAC